MPTVGRMWDEGTGGGTRWTTANLCYTTDTATTTNCVDLGTQSTFEGPIKFQGDIDIDLRIKRCAANHFDEMAFQIESNVNLGYQVPHGSWACYGGNKRYAGQSRVIFDRAMVESSFLDVLQRQFSEALIQQAKEEGKRIAHDLASVGLQNGGYAKYSEVKNKILSDCVLEIPIKGEIVKIPLGTIVQERVHVEGEKVSDALIFDFKAVQRVVRLQKKKIYVEKMKSISIQKRIVTARIKLEDAYNYWSIKDRKFKNMTEDEVEKELKALTLLKRLVKDEEFTKYMHEKYIDVPDVGDKNKVYRIHRDKRIEIINLAKMDKNRQESGLTGIEDKLCIHLVNPGGPITDEVIMKLMFARYNPKKLMDSSNHYRDGGIYAQGQAIAQYEADVPNEPLPLPNDGTGIRVQNEWAAVPNPYVIQGVGV